MQEYDNTPGSSYETTERDPYEKVLLQAVVLGWLNGIHKEPQQGSQGAGGWRASKHGPVESEQVHVERHLAAALPIPGPCAHDLPSGAGVADGRDSRGAIRQLRAHRPHGAHLYGLHDGGLRL